MKRLGEESSKLDAQRRKQRRENQVWLQAGQRGSTWHRVNRASGADQTAVIHVLELRRSECSEVQRQGQSLRQHSVVGQKFMCELGHRSGSPRHRFHRVSEALPKQRKKVGPSRKAGIHRAKMWPCQLPVGDGQKETGTPSEPKVRARDNRQTQVSDWPRSLSPGPLRWVFMTSFLEPLCARWYLREPLCGLKGQGQAKGTKKPENEP